MSSFCRSTGDPQKCTLSLPQLLTFHPIGGLYNSVCLDLCRVIVNTFTTNSARLVSDNSRHRRRRSSDVLWPNGTDGSGDAGETRALLLKPRQNTAASPDPEVRKTQARNYRCHSTHARTE